MEPGTPFSKQETVTTWVPGFLPVSSSLQWLHQPYTNTVLPFVWLNFLKLFYCCSITVVCIFSPPFYLTPAKPTSFPCFHPSPWFCPCVLYSSSWKPFSPLSLPHFPLAIVKLFLTSMTLIIFCLFVFSFLIMFQLKVRSYGICPSPPGLFHWA